ncbi:hypothetical protein [Microbacterium sp. YY-01]|uniref:hypothetical protein n=1 Tax=Microbacterium sp. YY-01 TaxID=3421634 RepID=UPI003D16823F
MTDTKQALTVSRRRLLQASVWSTPVVATAVAIPAAAASAPLQPDAGGLVVQVAETLDTPGGSVRVYRQGSTSRSWPAWLPAALIITNPTGTPIAGARGRLQIQMQAQDTISTLAYRLQARSLNTDVRLLDSTPTIPATTAPRRYDLQVNRTVAPGETVTVPLEYFVPRVFASPDFTVLVDAVTFADGVALASESAQLGLVPGFSA